MRAVVQRVSYGQVTVDNRRVADIYQGLVVLLGVSPTDTGSTRGRWLKKSPICASLKTLPVR